MSNQFFDSLYNGYTGEYQLMASLYRHGLDALRPPADMGIDVVSLNLKQRLEDPTVAAETFLFQVKTAMTEVGEVETNSGAIRTVYFKLSERELDLLAHGHDRVLFCYVYNTKTDALTDVLETPFMCFWIDGERLAALREAGAFTKRDGETKLTLSCQLRKPAHEYGHWYALVVDADGKALEHESVSQVGYLGTIGGYYTSSDEADHYSVGGYLDYARKR
ncbi:hypothetical protein [Paratractidigestivibacter sp.]|uniref:hypothetical protein n=1 Tax=Paratractidigestivibacter sp. TaxID=2847316 RepID=UPI002AC8C0DA|nr:hypothetical protein [Paratractidigestivibacter sp.]